MSFILQRNTFWHRGTKGLALSHTAREQQIASQVGSFLAAESSEGLQSCTQELPGPLFLTKCCSQSTVLDSGGQGGLSHAWLPVPPVPPVPPNQGERKVGEG